MELIVAAYVYGGVTNEGVFDSVLDVLDLTGNGPEVLLAAYGDEELTMEIVFQVEALGVFAAERQVGKVLRPALKKAGVNSLFSMDVWTPEKYETPAPKARRCSTPAWLSLSALSAIQASWGVFLGPLLHALT